MHFPIYSGATQVDGASGNDALPSALYNATESTANIFVTSGIATRYSGICWTALQPSIFWNEMLGFNNIAVAPSQTATMNFPLATDVITVQNSFKMPVVDGVNITGAFPGLDLGVVHDDTLYGTPVFQAPTGTPANVAQRTNDVSSIFSSRTFNSSLADEGYFLLDIRSNFQVTIRNPDRTLVDNHILQPKNTVFIEVVKAIKELEKPTAVSRTA